MIDFKILLESVAIVSDLNLESRMIDSKMVLESILDSIAFAFSMDCHDFANAKSSS